MRADRNKKIDILILIIGIEQASNRSTSNNVSSITSSTSFSKSRRHCIAVNKRISILIEYYNVLMGCKKIDNINEITHNKRNFLQCTAPLSRRITILEMIFTPNLSCISVTKYFFLMWSFLNQIGFKVDNKSLLIIALHKDEFLRNMKKLACETLIALSK